MKAYATCYLHQHDIWKRLHEKTSHLLTTSGV